ncbi:MAG: ATP-dependent DNA ligase, partial [Actinomycetota bacterium]
MSSDEVLLADVVATSAVVAATRSRKEKVAALARLLRRLQPDEVEPAVGFLVGQARQGRIGVGWRTAYGVEAVHAEAPTITVLRLDADLTALAGAPGAGSVAVRQHILGDLFSAATPAEAD